MLFLGEPTFKKNCLKPENDWYISLKFKQRIDLNRKDEAVLSTVCFKFSLKNLNKLQNSQCSRILVETCNERT